MNKHCAVFAKNVSYNSKALFECQQGHRLHIVRPHNKRHRSGAPVPVRKHFAHDIVAEGERCPSGCKRIRSGETEWHRQWKSLAHPYYTEWYMKPHVADIFNQERAQVIELQHSRISKEDITARENHYKNMIWLFHVQDENTRIFAWKRSDVCLQFFREYCFQWCTRPVFIDVGKSFLFKIDISTLPTSHTGVCVVRGSPVHIEDWVNEYYKGIRNDKVAVFDRPVHHLSTLVPPAEWMIRCCDCDGLTDKLDVKLVTERGELCSGCVVSCPLCEDAVPTSAIYLWEHCAKCERDIRHRETCLIEQELESLSRQPIFSKLVDLRARTRLLEF